MSELKTLYPPSPPDVPEGLTDYADSFAKRQKRVLTGLFVFLIFYFTLIALAAMVGVWCGLTFPGQLPALKIAGIVLSTIAFLFLVKGFFKRPAVNREMYVEIHDDEHPVLFDFIQQLCYELRAPFPNRVYLCPDVIAEYTVSTSIFNLLTEPKRDLLIGMGLVNCTNLSEFKAVLAHEFGQFCHLGRSKSYCAVVQNIVFDMIEGEDFFDRFLKACRRNPETDADGFQIKMLTWPLVYPITWMLEAGHAVLWVILKTVALPGRSMIWEQEFHADLVAVSAAGSDALTHCLLRVRFGMQCFNQAIDELVQLADDHDLYSNDMYLHQDQAAAIVRWKNQQPDLGLPPALPELMSGEKIRVFDSQHEEFEDEDTPPMWRAHPSNADREENAKEHFVPAVMDHRSPWILFENVAELKEYMSYEFYRVVFHIRKNADLVDAREVQGYIDKEYPEIIHPAPAPVAEVPRIALESGELRVPQAVESISLVPLEEPIPVVNVPPEFSPTANTMSTLPVANTMPGVPDLLPTHQAALSASEVDELQGETVFDEVIQVVEADANESKEHASAVISVQETPLTPQPSSSASRISPPPLEDEPFAIAEAVSAEAVAEATPVPEPFLVATAIEAESIPAAEPVLAMDAVTKSEAPTQLEPALEVVAPLVEAPPPEPVVVPWPVEAPSASEPIVVPAAELEIEVAEPVPVLAVAVEAEVVPHAEVAPPISLEAGADLTVYVESATAEHDDSELTTELEIPFSIDPEPEIHAEPAAVVESEVVIAAAPVPEPVAAEPETVVEAAPVTPSERPHSSAASVAFGSASSAIVNAVPTPVTEGTDGCESEVFTLDEVAPVPDGAGSVLALDADGSGSSKKSLSVAKVETVKSEPRGSDDQPVTVPSSDPSLKPIVKIGIAALSTPQPKPDTGATPAPRGLGITAASKPDANATPMPRPAFGSGPHQPLISCTVSETVVPAEGRRPAVRITFVKPGEKSPIKK